MDKKIITKYTWMKGVIVNKFSYFSTKTCVVGTQNNYLNETDF